MRRFTRVFHKRRKSGTDPEDAETGDADCDMESLSETTELLTLSEKQTGQAKQVSWPDHSELKGIMNKRKANRFSDMKPVDENGEEDEEDDDGELKSSGHDLGSAGVSGRRASVLRGLDRMSVSKLHREMSSEIRAFQRKLSKYRAIQQELADTYSESKSDCVCFRYSDMKSMVQEALNAAEKVHMSTGMEEEDGMEKSSSPIFRLLKSSRRMSVAEHLLRKQEEKYCKLSLDELYEDLLNTTREHEYLRMQVDHERMKFFYLSSSFDSIKQKRTVCGRFSKLCQAIEQATLECLFDS